MADYQAFFQPTMGKRAKKFQFHVFTVANRLPNRKVSSDEKRQVQKSHLSALLSDIQQEKMDLETLLQL